MADEEYQGKKPEPGDKFISVGTSEDGEDETLTVREVVENEDLTEGNFEVIAEEDDESYEISWDEGSGTWTSD